MTPPTIDDGIGLTWVTIGIVWLLGMLRVKPKVRSEPGSVRAAEMALAILGSSLIGSTWYANTWLATRVFPNNQTIRVAGLVLTVFGGLFAIWARFALAGNWSGHVSVKEGHELITAGPYAFVRHPIYSGLLTALTGTALANGQWRAVLGLSVLFVALWVKIRCEEKFMLETFPVPYQFYRRRVKRLIPWVF